jgi:F-box protein 42
MGTYPSPKACSSLVVYEDSLLLFGGWTHPSLYPLHQSWKLFNELHLFSVPEKRCDTLPDNLGLRFQNREESISA